MGRKVTYLGPESHESHQELSEGRKRKSRKGGGGLDGKEVEVGGGREKSSRELKPRSRSADGFPHSTKVR